MLKVKRFVKVILCFCVAFSMFISVNAETIYNNGVYNGSETITAGTNNLGVNLQINYDNEIIKSNLDIELEFKLYIPDCSVNNYNPRATQVSFAQSYEGLFNNYFITLYPFDVNNTSNTYPIEFNNNILTFKAIIPKVYNNAEFIGNSAYYIYYYSTDRGQIFNFDIDNNRSFMTINKIVKPIINVKNNIEKTFNSIIEFLYNIFSFITDKPWIILLGVSVSLISFLIYKAKTII